MTSKAVTDVAAFDVCKSRQLSKVEDFTLEERLFYL